MKTQKPLARQATLGRRLGRGRAIGVAQSVEIRRIVDDERTGLRRGEQSRLEFRRERRLFLIQRAKLRLAALGQTGAGADELEVIALEQVPRFARQTEIVARLVELSHAR